jgi:hypothetical protein
MPKLHFPFVPTTRLFPCVLQYSDIANAGAQWTSKLLHKLAVEKAACKADPTRHQELHHFPDMQMWTKLRPGVAAFLEKVRLFLTV